MLADGLTASWPRPIGIAQRFGMTGRLKAASGGDDLPEHLALLLRFEDGSRLAYLTTRKLGRIGLADSVEDFVAERGLGTDALDLDRADLEETLEGRRSAVKAALMNQRVIARDCEYAPTPRCDLRRDVL